MTQPKFAPILPDDEVRALSKLAAPEPWTADRPAAFRADPGAARKVGRGSTGSDQGYALLLAERYGDRITLAEGEHADDVLCGAGVIAMRRASLFGRAPVAGDIELALRLFGFIGGASEELTGARRSVFGGVAHSYERQRELADLVPESTLQMSASAFADALREDSSIVLAGFTSAS